MIDFDDIEDTRGDDEVFIELDADGVPRGGCRACKRCRIWMRGPSTAARCHDCLCPTEAHENLGNWVDSLIHNFTSDRRVAIRVGLPLSAYHSWSVMAARTFICSRGAIRPAACAACPDEGLRPGALVSVVCPTMEPRHRYHKLLYENYRSQTYEPRELVVVDTGHQASDYLQQCAQSDPSLSYHWIPMQPTGLMTGTKRNICCQLSRGAVIAHFDDDDIYAPNYLEFMVQHLLGLVLKAPKVNDYEHGRCVERDQTMFAATLKSWHLFDSEARQFKFYDVTLDEKLSWKERKEWIYGWGFSYVYTKACWRAFHFPDVFFCEDNEFMKGVARSRGVISFVDGSGAVCSHTYHPKVSTSTGESHGGVACGENCPVPPACFLKSLRRLVEAEGGATNSHTRYFLAGTWSNWSSFHELQRQSDGFFRLALPVPRPPQALDFQVFADEDWARCFYPDVASPGRALGPWRCHGVNWHAEVSRGFHALNVCWDPQERQLSFSVGEALPVRFFAIGSWSEWRRWDPLHAAGERQPVHRLVVQGLWQDETEFQLAQGKDWGRRYWLEAGGTRGPGTPPAQGLNWVVRKPAGCQRFNLELRWDPFGPGGPSWSTVPM